MIIIIIIVIKRCSPHRMLIQMAFKGSLLASHLRSLALICVRLLQLWPADCAQNTLIPQPLSQFWQVILSRREVIRIIGKCMTKVTKQVILESSGLLQVCTEHKSRSEAAVHAMNSSLVMEQPTTCCCRQFASFQELTCSLPMYPNCQHMILLYYLLLFRSFIHVCNLIKGSFQQGQPQ